MGRRAAGRKEGLNITLPEYRSVILENIPAELKALKIWAVWKPQIIKSISKPGKLPLSWQINKATGENEVKPASCDDPDTWMTFEDALSLLKSARKYKGLRNDKNIISSISVADIIFDEYLGKWNYRAILKVKT